MKSAYKILMRGLATHVRHFARVNARYDVGDDLIVVQNNKFMIRATVTVEAATDRVHIHHSTKFSGGVLQDEPGFTFRLSEPELFNRVTAAIQALPLVAR
jgi:hypothetical protein